jgi:MFS family permease
MNPWKGLKNLPRNVWLISGATLINRAGSMVLPFLALYLTQGIGASAAEAGIVLTIYGVGALITAPFVGKLSDRIGAMNVMKTSLLSSGVVFLIFPFFDKYYSILVLVFILSILSEAFRPASMAFLSDQGEATQRKTIFALYRLAINLGMSIGPLIGGFLTTIDFSLLFYVDGATTIIAGIYLVVVHWDKWKTSEDKGAPEIMKSSPLPVYKDYRYMYYLLALLPVSLVFFQNFSTMPLFIVEELGHAKSTFGILFTVNTVLIIIVEVPLNSAMSKWHDWKPLVIGSFLTAIGFGAMAFVQDLSLIVITIIIWTFGEMILFPSAAAYVAGIAPQKRRGEYMGYYQMLFSTCFIFAPLIGTNVYQFYGSSVLWIGTFVFGLISALMMIKLRHHTTSGVN